jgi:hypothetical protein
VFVLLLCVIVFSSRIKSVQMTLRVASVTGCLAVTAAAKQEIEEHTVGNITVRLSFDAVTVVPPSNGTVEREAERAILLHRGGSSAVQNITLDVSLQQAYELLSELEDMQVSLISADR